MMKAQEHTFGVADAKTRWSDLLTRVSNGAVVTITRYGVPVAQMVPIHCGCNQAGRRAAIMAMRELSKHTNLNRLRIKSLIVKGRK